MTVKLALAPRLDEAHNGLEALARALVENPRQTVIVVAVAVVSEATRRFAAETEELAGMPEELVARLAIVAVEPMLDDEDRRAARALLDAAQEARSRQRRLDLEADEAERDGIEGIEALFGEADDGLDEEDGSLWGDAA